jgi:outer membrane lipoprotein SlyB
MSSFHVVCAAALIAFAWADPGHAQPAPGAVPVVKPATPLVCVDCGTITRIREVQQPVPPQRQALPGRAPGTTSGGLGSDNRTVPLFSVGREGFERSPPPPVTRSQWEVTVRFDNGAYGLVVEPTEPSFRVGNRVKLVDDRLEELPAKPGEVPPPKS